MAELETMALAVNRWAVWYLLRWFRRSSYLNNSKADTPWDEKHGVRLDLTNDSTARTGCHETEGYNESVGILVKADDHAIDGFAPPRFVVAGALEDHLSDGTRGYLESVS